jgi:CheY-like chemotaxis protein
VLIVSGDSSRALLWRKTLIAAGAIVVLSTSVPSATQVLQELVVDVVLVDLRRPGGNVLDVVFTVRNSGRRHPVLLVAIIQRGGADGGLARSRFDAVLEYPVAPSDVCAEIHAVVSRRAAGGAVTALPA